MTLPNRAAKLRSVCWNARPTFYDYRAEHWKHIRTSSIPNESTFATVRHRPKRTNGCLNRKST